MEFAKSVNVLGTEYSISFGTSEKFPCLDKMDGFTDVSTKEIVIDDLSYVKNEDDAINDINAYIRQVLRHEILHAFLSESGLKNASAGIENWAVNEEMVDWFAIQSPKIFKAYQEVGCLG